ncbi:MAG TPA: zinc-binding alcohol dehydrogenase [Chthonomonas sp.]|uniref:zinc-dependent alcohol dehydrogenase n=1 Tax=Chthonomonas sp. TaxID=2282153 RepID=UPI002B4B40D1|nr:zinc-binding alcohol dehydrogenase [Chthonomonas sp.]HLI47840.1 zinc-binding alcohol dehydrogenase [Chthonomonas sp.]
MPKEIVTKTGEAFWFREYTLPPLQKDEVRVQVTFAAPKHGTELKAITGSVFDRKRWDKTLRIFLPKEEPALPPTERTIGNMVVGTVIKVGANVERWKLGDLVFGYGPVREIHQAKETHWHALDTLSPSDAVCVDPAHVAFVAIRDGNIRVGDDVAIFGLGAIGQMAVQIAKAAGANAIFGVDPLAIRRDCAELYGATATFDPTACDVGLAIKQATNGCGVDVSVETSGSASALHQAIRCLRQCGTVVHVPWGPQNATDLHLDEEFHLNRPTIVGSQAWEGWGNPDRSHPLWTPQRAFEATIELFRKKLLSGAGVVNPILSFADAPAALADLFHHPEQTIKVGIRF